MILAAHQPAYLPWLGYFDKLRKCDQFIFLDSVQFEKNSFTNRNKIKTAQGQQWLTVPVRTRGHTSSSLRALEIDPNVNWSRKHLASIAQSYSKAPAFSRLYPQLELLYAREHQLLSDLCWEHLEFWCRWLGVNVAMVRSSDLAIDSAKSQLILDLCVHFGASTYLSGALGRDYLDLMAFERAGVRVEFQDYVCPPYPQLWGAFVPNLAIVDFAMNGGSLDREAPTACTA